jgi:SAM-dependent methyltransferase
LRTPAGRYVMQWMQDRLDHELTDAFGFHALQLGLPEMDGLRANRMPHRWVASDSMVVRDVLAMPPPSEPGITTLSMPQPVSLHCEFDALPFPDASIDLIVLPFALELARDPHQTLREVERVLVPEGRLVIIGFNPASLWGLRQRTGRTLQAMGVGRGRSLFLPRAGDFIGYWRLRDWMRLLGFEVQAGRFGCWRPPVASQAWLDRSAWMDVVGDRWWPVLGALYFVSAVKRVRGMRLVGLMKPERRAVLVGAPATAPRQRQPAPVQHTSQTKQGSDASRASDKPDRPA